MAKLIEKLMGSDKMISFEEAHRIVLDSFVRMEKEKIHFTDSSNRTLAEFVLSDIDLPPFNKASVDGFACRKGELEMSLEVIETIPAGKAPERELAPGQCSRIMTGAMIPVNADCVIMVEETEILSSGKIKFKGEFKKENIAWKGEDVKKGTTVLKSGRIIKPQDIAVMASVGCTSLVVSKMPKIAVISSGDELVEPDTVPEISQIRNSNAYQLMAQIERAGGVGKYYGIARDNEEETFSIVTKALSENDIVLLTGGVSMGDFDFIPAVLEHAGVKILFTRIAVQPGKPTTFGLYNKKGVFGLPGNPVSSFIQFELLVRPLIAKMMGSNWKPLEIMLPMKQKFSRKYADRRAFIPVAITTEREVLPIEFHGSAHISALPFADGVISLPAGINIIEKGEIVGVRQI
jgi:molybdopterin molybdotransferase